jgi:hypothetical protein
MIKWYVYLLSALMVLPSSLIVTSNTGLATTLIFNLPIIQIVSFIHKSKSDTGYIFLYNTKHSGI